MKFLARFSLLRAFRDLRRFLLARQPHELWFFIAALGITSFILWAFVVDSRFQKEYKPNIIYVQSWPANRSEAEILAAQRRDGPAERKAKEARARAEAEHQAEVKRLKDKLDPWL